MSWSWVNITDDWKYLHLKNNCWFAQTIEHKNFTSISQTFRKKTFTSLSNIANSRICLGFFDMGSISIGSLYSAILFLYGAEYCYYPTAVYLHGSLTLRKNCIAGIHFHNCCEWDLQSDSTVMFPFLCQFGEKNISSANKLRSRHFYYHEETKNMFQPSY